VEVAVLLAQVGPVRQVEDDPPAGQFGDSDAQRGEQGLAADTVPNPLLCAGIEGRHVCIVPWLMRVRHRHGPTPGTG
jgi:hypothetical protein